MEVIGERGDFSAVEIFLKYSQTAAQKLRRKQKLFFKRHGYKCGQAVGRKIRNLYHTKIYKGWGVIRILMALKGAAL